MTGPCKLSTIFAAVFLTGCSTINPYQRSEALDSDLITKEGTPGTQVTSYAQNLGPALRDLHLQRVEWFDSLSSHARTAHLSSLAVYSLSAWGLYQGLKPGFVKDGVASEATRRNVAKAGIGAGSAYAVGNLFLNPKHDETYVEGFKALSCLMARARPYLLSPQAYEQLVSSTSLTPTYTATLEPSLSDRIRHLDTVVLRLRFQHGIPRNDRTTFEGRALQEAEQALRQARKTLLSGEQLRARIDSAAFQLRRQGDLIVAAVSEELRRNNVGIVEPELLLANLKAVTGRFQAIAPVPESGEPGEAQEESDAPAPVAGAATPGTPAAKTLDPAVAQQFAEVNKRLEALIKSNPNAERALASEQKAAAKNAQQRDRELTELRKKNAEQDRAIAALSRVPRLADTEFVEVVEQTALLYAARRVVNQFLVNHYDMAGRVRNIPECRGGGASLAVFPADDRTVQRGSSYRFQISGAKGVPAVSLQGNPGTPPDNQRSLAVSLEGTVVIVDLHIGSNAPAGELRLLISDAVGRGSEEIVLSVPAAKSDNK